MKHFLILIGLIMVVGVAGCYPHKQRTVFSHADFCPGEDMGTGIDKMSQEDKAMLSYYMKESITTRVNEWEAINGVATYTFIPTDTYKVEELGVYCRNFTLRTSTPQGSDFIEGKACPVGDGREKAWKVLKKKKIR